MHSCSYTRKKSASYMYNISLLQLANDPKTVVVFPGQQNVVLECEVSGADFIVSWNINGTEYTSDQLTNGNLPGHNIINGTDIIVTTPHNNTSYTCIVSLPSDHGSNRTQRVRIFLYIAGMYHEIMSYIL